MENYLRDFNALAEWFRLKWDYENTPALQRPTSLAWDISKTNLTKNSRSGKSTPSVGSGRNSPNVSGKLSPKNVPPKSRSSLSAPTSPLPSLEPTIIEGKATDWDSKQELANETEKVDAVEKEKEQSTEQTDVAITVSTKIDKQESSETICDNKSYQTDSNSEESVVKTSNVHQVGVNKTFVADGKATKAGFETETSEIYDKLPDNNMTQETGITKTETRLADSPSEDQRTYDIFRKTGVQNAEKGTSTDDDFPRLPNIRKSNGIKVNQECQTDDIEKKTLTVNKSKIETTKTAKASTSMKPAYSTALTRSISSKAVPATKTKFESAKPTMPARNVSKFTPRTSTTSRVSNISGTVSRTGLSRSKTVGDMKSTSVTAFKPMKVENKPTRVQTNTRLNKKPNQLLNKSASNDCSSSVETLVNHGKSLDNVNATNSSNSIASSSETLNNDNVKNDSLHSDGWLTVRNRSRKSSYSKPRKSDSSLSWATRFHQVSATASLPTLALLPEANDGKTPNKSIDKTAKDNFNALKSIKKADDVTKKQKTEPANNTLLLKRSHTTLSKLTLHKRDSRSTMQEKDKTNHIIKKTVEKNSYVDLNKKNSDVDSETDDESRANNQDDLSTEEEDQRKAIQLCEEEEMLEQQIAQLQGMDIDVDTETDGTETEGDNDEQQDDLQQAGNDDDDHMSLEARYEPMLAGNCCFPFLLFIHNTPKFEQRKKHL